MTVLSTNNAKTATSGFAANGRYSYITLLLDFAQWDVYLPWVRASIAQLNTSQAFMALFAAIIVQSKSKSQWCKHPDARAILQRQCATLIAAWETTLASSPDRDKLTLEYLADALKSFAQETKLS